VGDVEQLHRVRRPNRSGAGAVHTAILSAWTSTGQITKGQDDTQKGMTTRVRLRTGRCPIGQVNRQATVWN